MALLTAPVWLLTVTCQDNSAGNSPALETHSKNVFCITTFHRDATYYTESVSSSTIGEETSLLNNQPNPVGKFGTD